MPFLDEDNEVWRWNDCSGFQQGTEPGSPPVHHDAIYIALLVLLTNHSPYLGFSPPTCLFSLLMMGPSLRHLRSLQSRSQTLFSGYIVSYPLRSLLRCIIYFVHQVAIAWKAKTMSHSSFHTQSLALKPGYNWDFICSFRINRILNETPILSPATWPHITKLKYLCLHSLEA